MNINDVGLAKALHKNPTSLVIIQPIKYNYLLYILYIYLYNDVGYVGYVG